MHLHVYVVEESGHNISTSILWNTQHRDDWTLHLSVTLLIKTEHYETYKAGHYRYCIFPSIVVLMFSVILSDS